MDTISNPTSTAESGLEGSLSGPPSDATAQRQGFAHFGRGGELFGITLVNLVLKVLTLGVYHFWAKTRVRRYVWSHTHFAGEAFEYTGRGLELFLGYLIAMAVLVPIGAGFQFLPLYAQQQPWIAGLASLVLYPLMLFLMGFAIYASRRYLLSRTRWRSIRFGLAGSARRYGFKTLLYSLITALTFGIYLPFMRNNLTREMVDTLWFGDRFLRYDGRGRDLLKRFLAIWACGFLLGGLLVAALVVTSLAPEGPFQSGPPNPVLIFGLGFLFYGGVALLWIWYRVGEYRYMLTHTSIDGVRLGMTAGTGGLVWLGLSNLVLLFSTLGLGYAWVVVRTARYLASNLVLDGALALDAIGQHPAGVPGIGEGLSDAFDLGTGI